MTAITKPNCSVEGCEKPAKKRGWCGMHYERLRLSGNLVPQRPSPNASPEERLIFYGWTVTDTGCWEFAGARDPKAGYGRISVGRGPAVSRAHRVAYECWVGPIPEGLQIRHSCDNPPCINPRHLSPGTSAENHQDMVDRDRHLRGERAAGVKLTEGAVQAIREGYRAGLTQRALASMYGVTFGNIHMIVTRKTWRHIA